MTVKDNFKGFDPSVIEADLYSSDIENRYPAIVYHGRYGGTTTGIFTLDREASADPPGDSWEPGEVLFGTDPSSPLTEVWITERLRVCVIAQRKRVIISAEDGGIYTYPWLTPKKERVPGKYKAHYQIAVCLPDTGADIFVLGLKGFTKTMSWGNPKGGKFRDGRFKTGVEYLLKEYALEASKELGSKIPPYCTFWLDLVPARNDKGELAYVDVGYGTHTVPFTADLSSSPSLGSRFVGMNTLLEFQELRRSLIQWEKEWSKKAHTPGEIDPYAELDPGEEIENDDIPF